MTVQPCVRCLGEKVRQCNGPCPCPQDGRDIIDHSRADYCPLAKFGKGVEPHDWSNLPIIDPATRPRSASRPRANGPGTLARVVLEKLGFHRDHEGVRCPNGKTIAACGCADFEAQMNAWGVIGCLRHWREIVRWFTGKAHECGLGLNLRSVGAVIAAAWRRWRRKGSR